MDHKHLLKYLNYCEIQKSQREKSFAAIMPFADYGALNNSNEPEITIMMAIELLSQIGSALCYMHNKNIIHHDIKPQNILLFNFGFVLCDFSVSVVLSNSDQLLRDRTGTSVFMAPEISQNSYKPKPTDMWSLGITVFCLLFGKYPYNLGCFDQNTSIPPYIRITNNVMNYDLVFPENHIIPDPLKEIITMLLNKNPDERMTSQELVSNPWLASQIKERDSLLSF